METFKSQGELNFNAVEKSFCLMFDEQCIQITEYQARIFIAKNNLMVSPDCEATTKWITFVANPHMDIVSQLLNS